jgi:hypothetical protein
VRLPDEYRKDLGDYANAEVSPIHPNIDNILGEGPVIVDAGQSADDVINEHNMVANGSVYLPPPSQAVPCMNSEYDASKAADIPVSQQSLWKMNLPPQPVKVYSTSPAGETDVVNGDKNCTRNLSNTTGKVNVVSPPGGTVRPPSKDEFVPRRGDTPSVEEAYQPAPTTTSHEEDLMNSDHTPAAELNARWVDPAVAVDWSRAPKRVGSEDLGFKPQEPPKALTPQPSWTNDNALLPSGLSTKQLMEQGLGSSRLADADCTSNGGVDASANPQFNSAMKNSVKPVFPTTIEQQLDLSKDEVRNVDPNMATESTTTQEDQTTIALPAAPPSIQMEDLPPTKPEKTDFVLTKEVVSTDTSDQWRHSSA